MRCWKLRWKKAQRQVRTSLRTAAQWWTAYSTQSTANDLRKQVEKEDVAIIVLENLQALEATPHWEDGLRIIKVRLTLPHDRKERYMLDLCLSEMGVGLIEPTATGEASHE
jgi:hypothetical protein